MAIQKSSKTDIDEERIRALFNKAVDKSGAVGAQLSIVKSDKQFNLVHGLANTELDIPLTQDTLIQIGSTTKVFNAMVVMTLVDEGLLDLDTPVKKYIPEFEVADEKASGAITLRQLLSMSAGLANGPYTDHGAGGDALAKYVASLKILPVHYEPGTGFGYSNAGSCIAGYVAERVAGKAWDDLLMERILQPADLKNAATLERDLLFQRVSVGHMPNPKGGAPLVVRPWHLSRAIGPAGSTLAMSAHDLARFGKIFLNNGLADNGEQILSRKGIKEMVTTQTSVPTRSMGDWCIGPIKHQWHGEQLWGHAGGSGSGVSYLLWLPEQQGVMAFVMNTPYGGPSFFKVVLQEVMDAAFGVSKPEVKAPSQPITIENSQRYVGTYETIGLSSVVEAKDDQLLMKTIVTAQEVETVVPLQEVSTTLIPIGGDSFLVDGGENNPLFEQLFKGFDDISFFGDDGTGRATVLLQFGYYANGRKNTTSVCS